MRANDVRPATTGAIRSKTQWLLVDHIARRGVQRANERCLSCAEELEQNQNKGNVKNCSSDEAEEGR